MTRYAFFRQLSDRYGLDISDIMNAEESFKQKHGKKPNRSQLTAICCVLADVAEELSIRNESEGIQ